MPTPHIAVAPAYSRSWRVLVCLKGTSGTLTGLGVAAGPSYHDVRVEIDGRLLAEDLLAGTGNRAFAASGIGFGLPFASSLCVEMRDRPQPNPIARFWATYLTDPSSETMREEQIVEVDGHPTRYERVAYGDGEQEYELLTALGPALRAHVRLERDVFLARRVEGAQVEIELAGAVRLEAREGEPSPPQESEPEVHVRPAGRTTPVAALAVRDLTAEGGFFHDQLVLPARGDYEVVTNLGACANLPEPFLVL